MRRALSITAAALTLLALSGCTSQSSPKPSPTGATCSPGKPQAAATVKAGANLTVSNPGVNCTVKLTEKSKQVLITLTDAKGQQLASAYTKAAANGKYKTTLAIPSSASGSATVTLASGFRFDCGKVNCTPLTTKVSIAKLALGR